MNALCSSCLALLDIESTTLVEACAGRSPTTIYASDALAFPGIGLPKLKATCAKCGNVTVPIAVEEDVASSVAR